MKPSYWNVPYRKYTWVGNRISEEDMGKLYRLKQIKRKTITAMVAEAVRNYVSKEATMLNAFRELSEVLKNRKKHEITISFTTKNGKEVIHGKYDGLFSTVELGSATVPAKELRHWLKLLYGADVKTININY